MLFYGSSITQGGCASRPGNAYTSMLCRALDAEQINLSFSGSARSEKTVAEWIAKLNLACFVMDYDHNAPIPEHLESTHETFFRIVREKHPALPVVMLSLGDIFSYKNVEGAFRRREIVRTTFEQTWKNGDKNVYFIDGEILFGTADRDACTVDGCHPNDIGFHRMYEHIYPVLKQILG